MTPAGSITRSVPPGRSGRIWLRRRLDAASRGRDQLDRKLRVLLSEQRRLHLHVQRSRREWEAAYLRAQPWLRRAALLSGQDGVRHAVPATGLSFDIVWTSVMGVRIPSDIVVGRGGEDMTLLPPDNAAVPPAREAYRVAFDAGARLAAAEEAVRRLDAEVATTRRRLRALDRRWIPWLTETLRSVELALDEIEREDGSRLRRAIDSSRTGSP